MLAKANGPTIASSPGRISPPGITTAPTPTRQGHRGVER